MNVFSLVVVVVGILSLSRGFPRLSLLFQALRTLHSISEKVFSMFENCKYIFHEVPVFALSLHTFGVIICT